MALPDVGQARMLGDIFADLLREYAPASVAVLGCAGGNGLERISSAVTKRVVAVDVNPAYVEATRARFAGCISGLELLAGDIQSDAVTFPPVAFVFAALLFEYVDVDVTLRRIRALLTRDGVLASVVQLPSASTCAVTPSLFTSLQKLAPGMRLVPPARLHELAKSAGFAQTAARVDQADGGKQFAVQTFRCRDSQVSD